MEVSIIMFLLLLLSLGGHVFLFVMLRASMMVAAEAEKRAIEAEEKYKRLAKLYAPKE